MKDSNWRSFLFGILSLAGISSLLTHLAGILSMSIWGSVLLPAVALAMVALLVSAQRSQDQDFLERIQLGLLGGLLGTIGYDLFRVPFHYMGLNLFSPIRAYGLWLAGASSSSTITDLLGFGYHLSNGVTFGWIYALVALRRHRGWALLWGLILEALAVASPFGEVFGFRGYSNGLLLAFIAHLFFGWPLGVICERPDRKAARSRLENVWIRFRWGFTVAGVLLVATWFLAVRPAGVSSRLAGTVQVGPERILPTWSNLEVGNAWRIENRSGQVLTLGIRRPLPGGHRIEEREMAAGGELTIPLAYPGIYQLQSMTHPDWRSIFLSVSHQGDFRISTFLRREAVRRWPGYDLVPGSETAP